MDLNMCLEISLLELSTYLPGANELSMQLEKNSVLEESLMIVSEKSMLEGVAFY